MRTPGLTFGLWLAALVAPAAAADRMSLGAGAGGGYDGNVYYDRAPTAQVEALYGDADVFAGWAADATRATGGLEASAALRNYQAGDDLATAQRIALSGRAALYPVEWLKLGLSAGAERTAVRGAALSFLAFDLGQVHAEALRLGERSAFGIWGSADRARYDSLYAGAERRVDDRVSAGALASVDAFGTWRLEPAYNWAPSNVDAVAYAGPEAYLAWRRPLWRDAALRLSGETTYRRFTAADRVDRQWRAGASVRQHLGPRVAVAAWMLRVVNGSSDEAARYAWTTGGVRIEAEQAWVW